MSRPSRQRGSSPGAAAGAGGATGRRGFTLVEVAVVLAIIAVLTGVGTITFNEWTANQKAKDAARSVADLLFVGRSESIRTGVNHIAFFATDTTGATLIGPDGATPVAVVLIADADGDFTIDSGELKLTIPLVSGANISWGRGNAPNLVPRNGGASLGDPFAATAIENSPAELTSPANFRHPTLANTVQAWVVFTPDGTPRAFHPTAVPAIAGVGSGDGAIYVTNGERDYAVVMSALGGVKTFAWDGATSAWR